MEQSKSEECLKSTLINSDFNKEDKDQVLSESSKNDDEVVLQDMKGDLIWYKWTKYVIFLTN